MPDSTTKICTKCRKEFPKTLEFFGIDNQKSDGFHSWCRECKKKESKKWYANNSQKHHNLVTKWRENNKKIDKENAKKWRRKNPRKTSEYTLNHNARKRQNGGSHTAADIQKQLQFQKHHCYYCNKILRKKYHVDHVIPLIKGGSNSPDNLVCSCPRCNLSKGSKTLREWIEIIEDVTLYLRVAQRIVEREVM